MEKIIDRVQALRSILQENNCQAVIIPSFDPHQSEYVAEHWNGREWISGFTGSAGTVVVTADHLGLWTDSRYYLQATDELKAVDGVLHKLDGLQPQPYISWLIDTLKPGATVAIDGRLFPANLVNRWHDKLNAADLSLETKIDFLDPIWNDRPGLPKEEIYIFDEKYAGQTAAEKLKSLRSKIKAKATNGILISALDEIAWVLNLRGSDVAYNPIFYAYLYVGTDEATLFIDPTKLPKKVLTYLDELNIKVQKYDAVGSFLEAIQATNKIWIDRNSLNYSLYNKIGCEVHHDKIPLTSMKASKTTKEVKHINNAMQKDGVALVRTFMWLEKTLKERKVKEYEVVEKLQHFRSQQDLYVSESFNAIVGYKGNGAIVHYRADKENCAEIDQEGILLVDSGGQYLDGTTDITRTFALSPPTAFQKRCYTLVLKGHIALDKAVFPKGTTGVQLDTFARQFLWNAGLNYGHGTGHGVGYFMNVHEPPQGIIAYPKGKGTTPFIEGMFTSNEPGYYHEGEFGIRIENLVLTVPHPVHKDFFIFENLTIYPMDKSLIDVNLMTTEEIEWVNTYHQHCWEILSPHLTVEEQAWLKPQCEGINLQ